MSAALRGVATDESELDQVLERHPEFPRLIAVKIDAQTPGSTLHRAGTEDS